MKTTAVVVVAVGWVLGISLSTYGTAIGIVGGLSGIWATAKVWELSNVLKQVVEEQHKEVVLTVRETDKFDEKLREL